MREEPATKRVSGAALHVSAPPANKELPKVLGLWDATCVVVGAIIGVGIFFTPVIFNANAFGPKGVKVLMLNPLGPVLEGFRLAVIQGHNLSVPLTGAGGGTVWHPLYLVWSVGWGIGLTAVAALVFHRTEARFAEYV